MRYINSWRLSWVSLCHEILWRDGRDICSKDSFANWVNGMKKTFTWSILYARKFKESCCYGKEIQKKYPLEAKYIINNSDSWLNLLRLQNLKLARTTISTIRIKRMQFTFPVFRSMEIKGPVPNNILWWEVQGFE